jgi:hypothetical protein
MMALPPGGPVPLESRPGLPGFCTFASVEVCHPSAQVRR